MPWWNYFFRREPTKEAIEANLAKKQENGVIGAERRKNTCCFREKPRNIATIDFGTTHCSVTYQLNAHLMPDDEKPLVLKLDDSGLAGVRVPSCILFDANGDVQFFGDQARDHYSRMDHKLRPMCTYFEHIKMTLQHDASVNRKRKIEALNGKSYFLIDVIAHILCHLKEKLLAVVNDSQAGRSCDVTDFDWVITVPAIWKAKGKQMMREAGYKAGLCSSLPMSPLKEAKRSSPVLVNEKSPDKLSLALEPESAAIHCQQETLKNISKGDEKKCHSKDNHYLVLDIGGGTVDIATHSTAGGGIIELAPAIGNDWGGTRVNQQFEEFLANFIDDPGYSKYLDKANDIEYARRRAELTRLVYTEFESQKVLFGSGRPAQSFKIEFPRSFWKVYEDDIVEGGRKGIAGIQIEDDGAVMRITRDRMAKFFEPVVEGINELLESHIESHNLAKIIDTVYLVGGFGGCSYLREQIESKLKQSIPNLSMCIPTDPSLAVIYGATAFRCNPGIVRKRKANASYGLGCSIKYDESLHRLDYQFWNEDRQQYRCNHLFMSFVERGDFICTDEVFFTKYVSSKKAQQSMTLTMYSAPRKDIWYVTEDDVYMLGEITIEMGGYGLNREVELVLDVTHTELQLLARDATSGNECKLVADFLSSVH